MADGYSASAAVTVFFILSLFFTPLAASVGLWFVRSPEPIVAPPGDEVVFECSLNVPAELVRWRHMGELLSMDQNTDSSVRISSSSHLVVKVIDEKQAGDYQCVAWFGASALASTPAKLTLAELRPFLYQPPRHYSVSVGNIVTIDCPVPVSNPAPVIQYFHDDVRLPTTSEIVSTTGSLVLVNVTSKHSGIYTCSATNYITGQTVLSPVKTTVMVTNSNTPSPPRFLSTPQSLYVMQAGFNVSMECSGVGTPPPKITWRKETGTLPKERIEFTKAALRLTNIHRTDDGVYVCELSSGSGPTASHRITLQVQEAPVVKKEPGNSIVNEGGDMELQCEADGAPKPTISWLLNGESVDKDPLIHSQDGKLIIKQVQKRHAGIYQCFATNPVGVTFGSSMLQVSPKQVTAQGNSGDLAEIEDPELFDDNSESVSLIPPVSPGNHGHGKKEHSRNKTKPRRKDKKRKGNAVMIPPTRPNITRLSDKSVMVRWNVPTNDGLPIQFFKVQYRELGGHSRGSRWMTSNEDIPPHIRSYEVDGLETDRTYRFRIAAVYSNNDNKLGPNSARFHLHKGPPPSNREPLTPPSLTDTMAISPTAIQIQWQYLNSVLAPVDGFYVYYRATTSAGDYIKATVEGETTRLFNITHLQPDTAYDIKLQAFTVGAASDFSGILTRKTLKEPNATVAPEQENNVNDNLGTTNSDSGSGQLYVVLGAALAGLALLFTLILLICLCNKNRSNGNNDADGVEDCDKQGGRGREPGLTIQQLEPVVNMNGFTHNGKMNGM
ncbi:interference hedgehog-like isoform X2 [Lycorma delicatula]|uniref:interference hedgehog-like isoform X2 n=1 Tax=Lycorma delicatula TaxID=130591 RepID=UPI003F5125EC